MTDENPYGEVEPVSHELVNHVMALLATMPDELRYEIAEAYGLTPEQVDRGVSSWKGGRQ